MSTTQSALVAAVIAVGFACLVRWYARRLSRRWWACLCVLHGEAQVSAAWLGAVAVAERTGIPLSSVYRTLRAIEDAGFARSREVARPGFSSFPQRVYRITKQGVLAVERESPNRGAA